MSLTPLYLVLALTFSTWIQITSARVIQARDRAIEDSCHPHWSWATPDVTQADCDDTVDMFYDIEVKPLLWKKKEHDDYEFHSNKLPGGTGHPDRIMPRKYTVGELSLFSSPLDARKLADLERNVYPCHRDVEVPPRQKETSSDRKSGVVGL